MNDSASRHVGGTSTGRAPQGLARCTACRRLLWQRPAVALLLVLLVTAPTGVRAAPQGDSYVVKLGDTLANIAARTGVSVEALAQANAIRNANLIYLGQVLTVPDQSAPAAIETGTATASPGSVYVVRRDDTLGDIAARYGTSRAGLMSANSISDADHIYVGQRLLIKSRSLESSGSAVEPHAAPTAGRWIDVDLSEQRLTAYQGDTAIFSTLVSTGVAGWRTPVGEFTIRTKVNSQTMSGPGYNLPNVRYVMYFAGENAIHGTYWHDNFGHPMSHGCVNLPMDEAGWLYRWASIGTPVVTHN